jgi:haloalkane dehalogenase
VPSPYAYRQFRSAAGEDLVLDQNFFIEKVLPLLIKRPLLPEEMQEYRRPFATREDRWPLLAFPREIPIGGEPADVASIVNEYAVWLQKSMVPKLFIESEHPAALAGAVGDFCRAWSNQTKVTVAGIHFVQEDSGPEIGTAIADWLRGIRSK